MSWIKNIKLFYKIYTLYKSIKKGVSMKKFFEREFLLSLIPIIISIWGMIKGTMNVDTVAYITLGIGGLWTTFRQVAKITKSTKDDALVVDIENKLKP